MHFINFQNQIFHAEMRNLWCTLDLVGREPYMYTLWKVLLGCVLSLYLMNNDQ